VTTKVPTAPHLIPYQGSKRKLAPSIIALCGARRFERLHEPFAGSAALTIAAALVDLADYYVLGDSLGPLARLWQLCVAEPDVLSDRYASLWRAQTEDPRRFYSEARLRFNDDQDPCTLLYLLARCVKNAPRFAQDGSFNQTADHRRLGRSPARVRSAAASISALLRGRSTVLHADFGALCEAAGPADLVYLDPPYLGTTLGTDKRYHQGLTEVRLVEVLEAMNLRGVPWILSYDGRTGDKVYGRPLPPALGALHLEVNAGTSSQATLSGRRATTYESLYVSANLHGSATKALASRPELQRAGTIRP
jgi:DNA adenine methylase